MIDQHQKDVINLGLEDLLFLADNLLYYQNTDFPYINLLIEHVEQSNRRIAADLKAKFNNVADKRLNPQNYKFVDSGCNNKDLDQRIVSEAEQFLATTSFSK